MSLIILTQCHVELSLLLGQLHCLRQQILAPLLQLGLCQVRVYPGSYRDSELLDQCLVRRGQGSACDVDASTSGFTPFSKVGLGGRTGRTVAPGSI